MSEIVRLSAFELRARGEVETGWDNGCKGNDQIANILSSKPKDYDWDKHFTNHMTISCEKEIIKMAEVYADQPPKFIKCLQEYVVGGVLSIQREYQIHPALVFKGSWVQYQAEKPRKGWHKDSTTMCAFELACEAVWYIVEDALANVSAGNKDFRHFPSLMAQNQQKFKENCNGVIHHSISKLGESDWMKR